MKLTLFTGIFLILLVSFTQAQESSIWVNSSGEAVTDDNRSIGDVKKEALANARRGAVEKVVGVIIQSDTLVKDFTVQADFIASLSAGHILEEKIIKWDAKLIGENENSSPAVIYKVLIQAKVGIEKGLPDPAFKIDASLNRKVFKDGDNVILKIMATKDCYLTIFVVTEKKDVYIILPNRYNRNNFVKRGDKFICPTERDVARGLNLKAGLIPGTTETKEFIRIIATKNPIDFKPALFKEGIGIGVFLNETGTLGELLKELVAIPANERTDAYLAYEIVK